MDFPLSMGLGVEMAGAIACESGFHLAGRTCVKNTACRNDTCDGHGLCEDMQGFPRCTCHPGFATVGDRFCSACDSPQHEYPHCFVEEEHQQEHQLYVGWWLNVCVCTKQVLCESHVDVDLNVCVSL